MLWRFCGLWRGEWTGGRPVTSIYPTVTPPVYFENEPVNRLPSSAGMFLVVWPEEAGNGLWFHHAHPDRTVLDAHAGDVLVQRAARYRECSR